MLKGFSRKFRPLELLNERQVDAIWEGILDVLENTGLKFAVRQPQTLKAVRILDDAGCQVDYETKIVKFPRNLVMDCLAMCPSSFRIEARDPSKDMIIDLDRVYIQPGPGMKYLDIDTLEPREATRKEFYEAVTVYDALPNLHFYHPLAPNTTFGDFPSAMQNLETYVARTRNSSKVNRAGSIHGDYIFTMEIAKLVGAKGLYGVLAIPPLTYDEDRLDTMLTVIQKGFPLCIASGPIWGSSSPATIAGSVVSMSAEVMGGLILAQVIHEGHPLMVGSLAFPQNMRTGDAFFGNVTIGLAKAAFSQVWRRFKIPTYSAEPSIPNSKCMDFQSGYEKGMLALSSAICGDSAIWIHGTVYGELTAHPLQAIMDDDIAGMVGRFLEGVEVSEETLAIDLIKQVGSGPDFFLDKKHTRSWWQKEQFIPAVADTLGLGSWLKTGKKATIDLAKEKMENILATHKVSIALTPSQDEEIERILAEARKFFQKKGLM